VTRAGNIPAKVFGAIRGLDSEQLTSENDSDEILTQALMLLFLLRPGRSGAGFDRVPFESHEPVRFDPSRLSGVFKTPMEP
jgi:hypothetical protein